MSRTLLLALWVGSIAGVVEAGGQTIRFSVLGEVTNRSHHLWWMSPLAYVLMTTVLAALSWGGGRVVKVLRSTDVIMALLAFLAVFSICLGLFHPRISLIPLAIFAAGSGAVIRRYVQPRIDRFVSVATRSLPWLVGFTTLFGAGFAYLATRERPAPELSSGAVAESRPNILLVILDTVRRHNLSLYGYQRETTPELSRIADHGFTFERAFAPSPWTLPAHASMFTGRLPSELSADWNVPLDDAHPTVAELLTEAGYATGGFVANREYGTFQYGLHRGFRRYEDYKVSFGEVMLSAGLSQWIIENPRLRPLVGTDDLVAFKRAETIVDDVLHWIDGVDGQPFFAFVNLFDAHDPYLPPEDWYRKFGVTRSNRLSQLRRVSRDRLPTAAVLNDEMAAYDGAIAYIDAQLGRLHRELDERGLLDETIIIVTSDHGEEFGEHSLVYHGHSLYATQLWVPLVVVVPDSTGAARVAPPVTLRDVAATILDFANIDAAGLPGSSLARFWRDSVPQVDGVIEAQVRQLPPGGSGLPAASGDMRSTLMWPIHTIYGADGNISVYDLQVDPFALQDVRGRMFRPRQ